MISNWIEPGDLVWDAVQTPDLIKGGKLWERISDFKHQMMYMDTLYCLPDDILTKVDRASMALSIEVRVPILDHRVTEFGWNLPFSYKYKNGKGFNY